LKDKEYALSKLDDIKVGSKPAAGIKVSSKGHKDVELYFDKKSGLLVKKAYKVIDTDTSREVNSETVYTDFKEFDGLTLAGKFIETRDGKKVQDMELLEFERLKKVDPKEFEKPK
jgi:hypothetical protein